MSDVLQTEGLKTIYLRHQDAVLLDNGEIHTSDLDSQSIPEIIKEYKEHRNLIPELNGRRPKVVKKSVSEVAAYIDKTISNKNNFAFVDKAKISKIAEAARDILQKSAMLGVSDIHFEIYRDRTEINVRVDGRITPLQKQIPKKNSGC